MTREENDLLTRVGPGTAMGRLMRRYWLPVLHSHELPGPDCAPVRVTLLGEKLLAWRGTDGKAGLVDPRMAEIAKPFFTDGFRTAKTGTRASTAVNASRTASASASGGPGVRTANVTMLPVTGGDGCSSGMKIAG